MTAAITRRLTALRGRWLRAADRRHATRAWLDGPPW